MASSKRNALIVALLLVPSAAVAVPSSWRTLAGSTPLGSRMEWGDVATMQPPLDPAILQRRAMTATEAASPGASEILALYSESLQGTAIRNPWVLYAELNTDHAAGVAGVVQYARLHNRGSGWAAAFHAEPQALGTGTTIGVNVEAASVASTNRTIGVNLQAKNQANGTPTAGDVSQAINIQTDDGVCYGQGIRFNGADTDTGILFDEQSVGRRAVWIQGSYEVGIDTSAPIRLQAGTPLQLEGTAQVQIVFDHGRIEFRNGARVLAWIAIDGSANGGRLN